MTDDVDTAYYHIDADATVEEFLAVAKLYARAVADAYDLAVDVSALEWTVSKRAKRRAGAVTHRDGVPLSLSLTWEFFQTRGWDETAETIRHELIHVHLLNECGDASHGDRFRRLATRLDTHVHCERFAEPNWWIHCRSCGQRFARYRRSAVVDDVESYRCGACGGRLRRQATDLDSDSDADASADPGRDS